MSRLTRDGTAEPVSRDQILRREREQGNIHFPRSADLMQEWQPYPVDPNCCYMSDHTYIHTYNKWVMVKVGSGLTQGFTVGIATQSPYGGVLVNPT